MIRLRVRAIPLRCTGAGARRGATTVALVLAGALLAGCGPVPPLEVAVREFDSSVTYGLAETTAPPATTPVPPPVPAPAPVPALPAPPPPAPVIVQLPPPSACPSAGPLTAAAQPALPESTSAPQAASYPWRIDGSITSGGRSKPLPATATEQVTNVVSAAASTSGDYTYDVVDSAAGPDGTQTVTTSFEVVPEPAGGEVSGVATTQASGIYITKVTTANAVGGQPVTFVPAPPILYLPFPADLTPAPSWTVNSADGSTAETYTAHIKGHGRVDACGTVLDGWDVQISGGTITGPTENLTLSGDYFVGTEYGGIPLGDALTYSGTTSVNGAEISSTSTRQCDVVPEPPQ